MEVARRVSYKRVRLIQNVTQEKELDGKNNTSGSSTAQEQDEAGSAVIRLLERFGESTGFGDLGGVVSGGGG